MTSLHTVKTPMGATERSTGDLPIQKGIFLPSREGGCKATLFLVVVSRGASQIMPKKSKTKSPPLRKKGVQKTRTGIFEGKIVQIRFLAEGFLVVLDSVVGSRAKANFAVTDGMCFQNMEIVLPPNIGLFRFVASSVFLMPRSCNPGVWRSAYEPLSGICFSDLCGHNYMKSSTCQPKTPR